MLAFLAALALTPALLAAADPDPDPATTDTATAVFDGSVFTRHHANLDPLSLSLAPAMFLSGLLVAFAGYKLYRVALAATGFVLTGELAWIVLASVANTTTASTTSHIVYVAMWAIASVAGALALLSTSRSSAPSVMGVTAGFVGARVCRALFPTTPPHLHLFLLLLLALLGRFVALHAERMAVIGATSLLGTYMAVVAVDLVVGAGLVYEAINRAAGGAAIAGDEAMWEAIAVVAATVVAAITQACLWRHARFGSPEAVEGTHVLVRWLAGVRHDTGLDAQDKEAAAV